MLRGTVKLADKRAALMDMAKLRGWITDKTQQLGRHINPQAVTLVVVRCHHPCVIVPRVSTPATVTHR